MTSDLQSNTNFMEAQASIRRVAEQQADCVAQLNDWAKNLEARALSVHECQKEGMMRHRDYSYAKPTPIYAMDDNYQHSTPFQDSENKSDGELVLSEDADNFERSEHQRGNDCYNRGHFQEAIKCYTQCLISDPRSDIAFSNRAMAHLKLKEWKDAEEDATCSLQINPWNVKSLQRRSTARASLGKLRAALQDLQLAEIAHQRNTSGETLVPRELITEQRKIKKLLNDALHRAPRRSIDVSPALDGLAED